MRILSLALLSVFGALAFAQDSDLFDKAPPAIDEALRTRVDAFYQAHVDGKFRQADQYVAEDSKDTFFAAEKPRYKGCHISKITYSENFAKADVVAACKNEVSFHGERIVATMPAISHWRIDNGQWLLYYLAKTEMQTPFGTMRQGPDRSGPATGVPKDPVAAARSILAQVTVDRTAVSLDQTRTSRQEIHVKNGMPGSIEVSVDKTGVPGLTVTPVKPQLGPGEETAVVVEFNFEDPAILCQDCLVHPGVRPPATVMMHISPTAQQFPIQITFTQPQPAK
ncbi:MAG: hypothetical protein LAP38_15575 [Acidobacteriia bacterium]|nr:hypothetical protein [Terriglobia bacterium]